MQDILDISSEEHDIYSLLHEELCAPAHETRAAILKRYVGIKASTHCVQSKKKGSFDVRAICTL